MKMNIFMPDFLQFKSLIQQFPDYTEEAYNVAIPYFKLSKFKKGDFLIEEGKICKKIAFIQDGLFRIFYLKDGLDVTHCFCKENMLITAYRSLITKQPSELSIQALEDAELLIIQAEDLQKLYEKHLFWQQVGRMAAEQEFMRVDCYNRFLNDKTAKQRYLQMLYEENDIVQRVPLFYLASYLQIAPETLSRIRKEISTS
jgi:CRP-like cAMP-binding protein